MNQNLIKIKRALISVSDKSNIIPFAKMLHEHQVEIISTGGTAELLKQNHIPLLPIETITGNPESFGGRMKTISFQIGSALLFRRNHESDEAEAKKLNVKAIDLVVCNLYPFEKTAELNKNNPEKLDQLVETIDIGGPTMIRAASKNFESVACVTDPDDYSWVMEEISKSGGLPIHSRKRLALAAFTKIASYDLAIARELAFEFEFTGTKDSQKLRYGENPQQQAVMLKINHTNQSKPLAFSNFLQGKELSYNNLLDSDQSFKCLSELYLEFKNNSNPNLSATAHAVIVKHGTPCGAAQGKNAISALKMAWDCDSTSAFGGIIALDQTVDEKVAAFLKDRFVEVVLAPEFTADALAILSAKKNLRLLKVSLPTAPTAEWSMRSIQGALLCQNEDIGISNELKVVTKKKLNDDQLRLSRFGLIVTKYLKSNCIGLFGLSSDKQNPGMIILASGVGQPNRINCITMLAGPRLSTKLTSVTSQMILVSDAFFPFQDSIEAAHQIGVQNIIQPGGSVRDNEVIAACDQYGIAMAFTGRRHFRH
jgi:phosphoribosylaminoimidazolecarboxamide formyltransferase/IMP cyclohydrolase